MAPDRDAEAQQQPWQAAAGDELTPLLHNLRQPSAESGEGQPGAIQEEAPPPARRYYAWHVVWVVAAALLAVVFVKGWIDAGADVNVGGTVSSSQDCQMCKIGKICLTHVSITPAVRSQQGSQASPGRRAERCRCYGAASVALDGN